MIYYSQKCQTKLFLRMSDGYHFDILIDHDTCIH